MKYTSLQQTEDESDPKASGEEEHARGGLLHSLQTEDEQWLHHFRQGITLCKQWKPAQHDDGLYPHVHKHRDLSTEPGRSWLQQPALQWQKN